MDGSCGEGRRHLRFNLAVSLKRLSALETACGLERVAGLSSI